MDWETPGAMKTNYVLIDYENVQPQIVAALAEEHVKVLVFIGAHRPRRRCRRGAIERMAMRSIQ